MELKIKPSLSNNFPLGGFYIKSPLVKNWLQEVQELSLSLDELQVYPLPGITPNSVWGCFIIPDNKPSSSVVSKHELAQKVSQNFYIPEKSIAVPIVTQPDNEKLFAGNIHVYHPDIGFVKLEGEVNFMDLLLVPEETTELVIQPDDPGFVPKTIKSFEVKAPEPKNIIQELEEKAFPKKEKLPDEPLNAVEKAKLAFYKTIFTSPEGEEGSAELKEGAMSKFASMFASKSSNTGDSMEKMKQDFEELERRNKNEVNKLLDLLKKDPAEALKYAIPLDGNNSSRGTSDGSFQMDKRRNNFSLFGSTVRQSGGGGVNLNDDYFALQDQYRKAAKELVKKGEVEKAAFVYMKLLKDYPMAAKVMGDGEFYAEAATIYLKYAKDKSKAADCYEKGKMLKEAIEIHEELQNFEKAGDLYKKLRKEKKAFHSYEKAVNKFIGQRRYFDASTLYKNKMDSLPKAQETLLQGWDSNTESASCLNQYFSNVNSVSELKLAIDSVYQRKSTKYNHLVFLQQIIHEFEREKELANLVKDIAYEIIAKEAGKKPNFINEVAKLNKTDKQIGRDAMRFKVKKR